VVRWYIMKSKFGKISDEITFHISSISVIKIILILCAFMVAFILRDLILVVITAVVIAAAIEPAVRWFKSRRVPRLPAVIIIYAVLAVLVAMVAIFLLRPLIQQSLHFLNNFPGYLQQLQAWAPGENGLLGQANQISGIEGQFSVKEIVQEFRNTLSNISGSVFTLLVTVFGGVLSFVLIIVLSFYLSVQENGIARFLRMVTPIHYEEYILDLWKRSQEKIGLWMQGQLILVVIIGVLTYLGLLLIGVKHALLLAFLAGMAELIPLFGPILAMIPAILVAFTDGGLTLALVVGAFYLIIQQFENQLIYPLVVQKVVGVSPIVVILALVAGGQLAGFLGILLSVPASAIVMELLNDYDKRGEKHDTSDDTPVQK